MIKENLKNIDAPIPEPRPLKYLFNSLTYTQLQELYIEVDDELQKRIKENIKKRKEEKMKI